MKQWEIEEERRKKQRKRWFNWAEGQLAREVIKQRLVRADPPIYCAHDQMLGFRGVREDGVPVKVRIHHPDNFALPGELADCRMLVQPRRVG
jgi:hypothetical protein